MRTQAVAESRRWSSKSGTSIQGEKTTEQAIVEAGLDWEVEAVPLFTGEAYGGQKVENRAIIRERDQKVLGVVGNKYVPLQNKEAFKFFDPFIEAKQARIERAWSIRGGKDICILAELNSKPMEIAKDDTVNKFLLLSNSHKGGTTVRVAFSPIRTVCSNRLAMIFRKAGTSDNLMRVGHSNKMVINLKAIQETVNLADAEFNKTAEAYKFLAKKDVSGKKAVAEFVRQIFHTTDETERQKVREQKMNETIVRLFETGLGNDAKSVAGTYWALYNGVTEYLTHEAGKDDDRRNFNLWFGAGVRMNAEALRVAVEMAGG